MKNIRFHVGVASDVGNTKKTNQDSVLVEIGEHKEREFGLFIVCDGLGGLSKGEIASITAVKLFKDWWENKLREVMKAGDEEILKSLEDTILIANKSIYKYSKEINSRMGTTVTALFIYESRYYIVNVGDSRVYKINKKIIQETEDDSYIAMKIKNKEMTIVEAKKSKMKNILLQCVGAKENISVYKKCGDIADAKAFILCSDGFYNKFEEKEMKASVNKLLKSTDYDEEIQKLALSMVDTVKSREERDNISVIVVLIENSNEKVGLLSRLFER